MKLPSIAADSNSNLQIKAIPKGDKNSIEEGERLEFYIE
jgi:hypothetical protein